MPVANDDAFPIYCSICKEPKWSHEFHSNGPGQRRSACEVCRSQTRKSRSKLRHGQDTRLYNNIKTGFAALREERHTGEPTLRRTSVKPNVKRTSAKPGKTPVPDQPIALSVNDSSSRYVITYAQNATPVHEGFLTSLQTYCDQNDATLLVIPGRYKNPTSIFSDKMEHDEWWDESLHPYLFAGRLVLNDNLAIFGDISIQPTATRPLTGFEVFVGKPSAVFGHPKLQLQTVATAQRRYPRLLTTTGACTMPNYTDSKAGKKGHAHHVIGACVIERGDGGLFHMRQIIALDDGSFIDLDREYDGVMSRQAPRALALVCGDIHVDQSDEAVLGATLFGEDSIASMLRPEKIVLHDVLSFSTRNHHEINNFRSRYERANGDKPDSVREEVKRAVEFIDSIPAFAEAVVIASNHDEAFDRWLNTAEPKQDPVNAKFFHETWTGVLKFQDTTGEWIPAFELLYSTMPRDAGLDYDIPTVKFVRRDESYKVADIYLNFHGDVGLNGSRGSAQTYAKLGIKTITGHSHAPSITDGNMVVGVTGNLDQGYNDLPSNWLNGSAIVYANGCRSLIMVLHGKDGVAHWRGEPKSLSSSTQQNRHG